MCEVKLSSSSSLSLLSSSLGFIAGPEAGADALWRGFVISLSLWEAEDGDEDGRVSGSSLSEPLSWSGSGAGGGGGGVLVDDVGFGRKYLVMSFVNFWGLMGRFVDWVGFGAASLGADEGGGSLVDVGVEELFVGVFGERFLLSGEGIAVVDSVGLSLLDECFGRYRWLG